MKTLLKKALLILFLSAFIVPSLAQQNATTTFAYDANGNRIIRQIDFAKFSENGKDFGNETPNLPYIEDALGRIQISVFPNPTQDKVNLTVLDNPSHEQLQVLVASQTGQVLRKKTITDQQELIDLSGYSSGIYFLELTNKEEKHVWKIVKH